MLNVKEDLEDLTMSNEPKSKTTTILSVNQISKATKKSMGLRVITGLVLALLVIPTIFLGGWFFISLVFLMSVLSVIEILRSNKISHRNWLLYCLSIFSSLAITFWQFVKQNMIENIEYNYNPFDITKWTVEMGFDSIQVSGFLLTTMLVGIFILLVLDTRLNFNNVSYLFLLLIATGFGFQAFLFLRLYPEYITNHPNIYPEYDSGLFSGSFLLIYVLLGTIMTDIGAYFIGVLFGKHKMIPHISPNKTWEGFVGGLVISFVITLTFGISVSLFDKPILPFLDHNHWYYLLLLSLIMPLAANIGDLFFSAVKRHLGIKDYGFILLGHGGILDRVDSLTVVSIVVAMLTILMNNGWSLLR